MGENATLNGLTPNRVNPTTTTTCRTEHAALAQNFLEWHTHRAKLEQTLCLALRYRDGDSKTDPGARSSHLWSTGQNGPGVEECAAWGWSRALRSASAALSATRSLPHVALLRNQIALALLAAPPNGALSPRARRLIDSPELTKLLSRCFREGRARAIKGNGGGAGGLTWRQGGAHTNLARTPLAHMLSGQRRHLTNQPSSSHPHGQRLGSKGRGGLTLESGMGLTRRLPVSKRGEPTGLGDAPLSSATRLVLVSGGWMPLTGLGTSARLPCIRSFLPLRSQLARQT